MKKHLCNLLALGLAVSAIPLSACGEGSATGKANLLRIASWEEYIDMGGDFYAYDPDNPDLEAFKSWYKTTFGITLSEKTKSLDEEFVDWYHKTYAGTEGYQPNLEVEYVPMQDNETMYNKIKMGDRYDLLCPSEYMAMKLKEENYLAPYSSAFFDTAAEKNHYVRNASAYTSEIFKSCGLEEYIAGYMWGTTGFIFNPDAIGESRDEARSIMRSWNSLYAPETKNKITAKDNVRDSYFMGLGMLYEEELLAARTAFEAEKAKYEQGQLSEAEYQAKRTAYRDLLSERMNDTEKATTDKVKTLLQKMRKNVYGLETDEGKMDVVTGLLDASYQWSGDAVFMINEAESYDIELEYVIPDSVSNIWFDGWVMMKGGNEPLATAFINFLSLPQNVVRNMYYVGYTSCLSTDEIFDYIAMQYASESAENTVQYDLSYFFGENHVLTVDESQTRRQLCAQYPQSDVIDRLVVMDYYKKADNDRINRMWINIK